MHPFNHNNYIVVDQTPVKTIFFINCGEVGSTLGGLELEEFLFWKTGYFLHHSYYEILL